MKINENVRKFETVAKIDKSYLLIMSLYVKAGLNETVQSSSTPVDCAELNGTVNTSTDCSSYSLAKAYSNHSTGNCTPVPYTGSFCRFQLQTWQDCTVEATKSVLLDVTSMEQTQEEKEKDVAQFLHFLREFAHCRFISRIFQCIFLQKVKEQSTAKKPPASLFVRVLSRSVTVKVGMFTWPQDRSVKE